MCLPAWRAPEPGPLHCTSAHSRVPSSTLPDVLNNIFAFIVVKVLTFGKTWYGEKGWTRETRIQIPALPLTCALVALYQALPLPEPPQ